MLNFIKNYHVVIYPIVFVVLFFGLKYFGLENALTRAVIAAGIGIVLSPRVQKVQTQSGEKKQLKWVFLKKVILID